MWHSMHAHMCMHTTEGSLGKQSETCTGKSISGIPKRSRVGRSRLCCLSHANTRRMWVSYPHFGDQSHLSDSSCSEIYPYFGQMCEKPPRNLSNITEMLLASIKINPYRCFARAGPFPLCICFFKQEF